MREANKKERRYEERYSINKTIESKRAEQRQVSIVWCEKHLAVNENLCATRYVCCVCVCGKISRANRASLAPIKAHENLRVARSFLLQFHYKKLTHLLSLSLSESGDRYLCTFFSCFHEIDFSLFPSIPVPIKSPRARPLHVVRRLNTEKPKHKRSVYAVITRNSNNLLFL